MKHLTQYPRGFRHLWWLVALLVLLMASYVVAGRQLMRVLPEWRAPLENILQQRSGLRLTIGGLHGRMEGLTPVLELDQLVLPAADANPDHALTIKQVSVAVDLLMSLLHRSVWLRDLRLSGLSLDIKQDQDGHFQLRGFPRKTAATGSGASLQSLLKLLYQQKQVILDQVDLSLKLQGMPLLATQDARLEMVSSGGHHRLALHLTTSERPLSLDLRLNLNSDAYSLADLDGDAYLGLSGEDIEYWLPPSLSEGFNIKQLSGRLAFWLSLDQGKLDQSTLALQVAKLVLAKDGQQWQVEKLHGQLAARYAEQGYQLQLRGLDFDTSGGHWHSGIVSAWWNTKKGADADWKLRLTELDLQQLGGQLLHWPFALPEPLTQLRDKLQQLRPQAQLAAVYVAGSGKRLTDFAGRFYQASVDASGKIPGVGGLSGWFDGTPEQGMAVLTSSQLSLDLPRLYDHELRLSVAGELRWFHGEAGLLRVETGRWRLSNADANAQLVAGITLVPGKVPLLHLMASLQGQHIERADAYLPTRRMPAALSGWLGAAIDGGQLSQGSFLYEGPVRIDKKRQQDRTFQMQFDVVNANLGFLPGWPSLTDLQGRVLVDGHRVYGHNLSGRIYDSSFSHTNFDVWKDKATAAPMLLVSGKVAAQAKDLGQLLHATPLAAQLPAELADWQLSQGLLDGDLLLQLALKKAVEVPPKVRVQAKAKGVSLSNQQRRLSFEQLAGEVHFDLQRGMQAADLSGKWLGTPLAASISTSDGQLNINAQGNVDVQQLAKWLQVDWLKPASGKAQAKAELSLPWRSQQQVQLQLSSNLVGVAVGLPPPFAKAAATKAPLSLSLNDAGVMHISYAGKPRLSGKLLLPGGDFQRGRLQLGAGKPAKLPAQGLLISGSLAQLVAKPWIDFYNQPVTSQGQQQNNEVPLQLDLQLGRLDLFGFDIPDAHFTAAAQPEGWQFGLASQQLSGSLLLPTGYQLRGDKPLSLKVTQLRWPALSASAQATGMQLAPSDLPIADVELHDLQLGAEKLGSWQGKIRPVAASVSVRQLKGQWRHTRFNGTLDWTEQAGKSVSHYVGSLSTKNLGGLQQAWGVKPLVVSDNASASVNLSWPGSPLDMDYLMLKGSANFEVGECRLPQMDNNNPLLRLLGALNVNSIARRLRLDFSDIYKKGLSCDSIDGKLVFDQQHLKVDELRMKSPSADITLSGQTNLKTQQLDNDMTVVLPLSSNLYAGCIAGPAACAGIFVFERLLGSKLEKAAALHYHVSGSWSEPRVKEK